LESWRVGELESWRVGELESWKVEELGSWEVGELTGKRKEAGVSAPCRFQFRELREDKKWGETI
jgi:hypothetical protein